MQLLWLLTFLFPFFFTTVAAQDHFPEGGECEYERFECKVKITSITQRASSRKNAHNLYEVKFTIFSMPELLGKKAGFQDREFVLLLNNSAYPGPRYLKKYNITVGRIFDCYCLAITRGMCTPRIFDFPEIRLDDYFESQP